MKSLLLLTLLALWYSPTASALIAGRSANQDEVPGALALYRTADDGKAYFHCSAVALSSRLVITAKHCLVDEQTGKEVFRPGQSYFYKSGSDLDETDFFRKTIAKIHRLDDSIAAEFRDSDITVIEFTTDLPFQRFAKLAKIPSVGFAQFYLSGFGCESVQSGMGGGILKLGRGRILRADQAYFYLASDPFGGFFPSLCPGDSGGGAYSDIAGEKILVGINSSLLTVSDYSAGSSKVVNLLGAKGEIYYWLKSLLET